MIPLLTLGLPTSATTAVVLAALQGYGLEPEPLLLYTEPDLVAIYTVIATVLLLPLARKLPRQRSGVALDG